MAYATVADMARLATRGWDDIAQRATRNARVSGELLRALYEGGDPGQWPAELVARARAALDELAGLLERVSRHADTYIAPRYGGVLPLPDHLVAGSDLPSVVAAIALRRLHGVSVPKDASDNTRWADEYLRDLAAGRVSLGATDTATAQPPGRMVSKTACKTIDWARYTRRLP